MAGNTVRQYFGPSGKYYLDTQWSSSSNGSAANSSDVTVKVYVGAVGGWSAYTGSTDLTIRIDGATVRSGSSASVSINGSEQLMGTGSKTVGHNSDGTNSINISVTFAGGSYLGTGSDSFTARLDTIPRKSVMKNSPSWSAGSNFNVSITRYSSSFKHEVEIYVRKAGTTTEWEHVKRVNLTTSETSHSTEFTTAENKTIFTALVGKGSIDTYIILQTYKGTDWIGSEYYYGAVTAPSASTATNTYFNILGKNEVNVNKSKSYFDHTVQLKFGNSTIGTHNGSVSGQSSSSAIDASYTASTVFGLIPNAKTIPCEIVVTTYFEGVKVRDSTTKSVYAQVINSSPAFTGTGVTYRDGVSSISTIMGTSPVTLVQNKSTLIVDIPIASRALAVNGSTMKSYSASINGYTVSQTWQSGQVVSFNMGAVNLPSTGTLTIKAKDSRGFETTITKPINIVSYSPPIVNISGLRQNNFEAPTSISVSGTFSPVKVGTTMKNGLVNIGTTPIQFHTRENVSTDPFTAYEPLTVATLTSNRFTSATVVKTFDTNKTYVIEVQVKDKFGTYTSSIVVAKGIPIFAIDTVKNSIGFKSVPTQNDVFEMFGKMVFAKSQYATGTSNDAPIDFANSDAIGINALYFNDVADNDGEGLRFPKTGAMVDKTKPFVPSEWNTLRIMDDKVYLDSTLMYTRPKVIWSGASFCGNTTETKFSSSLKALDWASTGLMFIFSDYDDSTSTTNAFNWVHVPVLRWQIENQSGDGLYLGVPSSNSNASALGSYANKYIYLTNTGFTGHVDNAAGTVQRDIVLRYIIAY